MAEDPTDLHYEPRADTRQRRRHRTARGVIKWLIVACVVGFLSVKFLGF